jgi:glycosyltransferase involved in cell wall biosynthesis
VILIPFVLPVTNYLVQEPPHFYNREPKTNSFKQDFDVFFWERTPVHVSIQDVLRWFKNMNPTYTIRKHLDPGQISLDPSYLFLNDRIKMLDNNWLNHDQYLAILEKARVFVAPRRWEGIGLSSLEAMSRGIPVVGLASPTLNEYIENGVTGVLIKDKFSSLPDIDFNILSENLVKVLPFKHELYRKQITTALSNFFLSDKSRPLQKPTHAVIPNSMTLRQYLYLLHQI